MNQACVILEEKKGIPCHGRMPVGYGAECSISVYPMALPVTGTDVAAQTGWKNEEQQAI